MNKKLIFSVLIILSLVFTGCSSDDNNLADLADTELSDLFIKVNYGTDVGIQAISEVEVNNIELKLFKEDGGWDKVNSDTIEITDNSIDSAGGFSNLSAGNYKVEVDAIELIGDDKFLVFSGEEKITTTGQDKTINIDLEPENGDLKMNLNLAEWEDASELEITLSHPLPTIDDTILIIENLEEDIIIKELNPRKYDISIVIRDSEGRDLATSSINDVAVLPGRQGEKANQREFILIDIDSVASQIGINGDKKMELPGIGEDNNEAAYTVQVIDQFGDAIEGKSVTWSVEGDPSGVSIEDGILTVSHTASAGSVTIRGEADGVIGSYEVEIVYAEEVLNNIKIISGSESITIPNPEDYPEVRDYEGQIMDQYGRIMEGESIIWSLKEGVAGVSIEGNQLTVTDGVEADNVTIVATANSNEDISVEMVVTLNPPEFVAEVTSIEIEGPTDIEIPVDTNKTIEYTATIKDQNGSKMEGEEVIWSLKGVPADVTIDEATGVVTVPNGLLETNFTIKTTSKSEEDISRTKEVNLIYGESELTEIIISGEEELVLPVESSVTEVYEAELRDQYGNLMEVDVSWSIEGEAIEGVSIAGEGVLTITSTANIGDITIKAETETKSEIKVVNIDYADSIPTEIGIMSGADTITIPPETEEVKEPYSAELKDQYGNEMNGMNWSIEDEASGISIDNKGKLKVESIAEAGSITIVATADGDAELKASKSVQLLEGDGDLAIDFDWELPPEAPKDLSFAREAEQITLTWADGVEDYPEGYIVGHAIYRSINEEPEERIDQIESTETEYVDSDIEISSHYEYRVAAYNQAGYRSAKSEVIRSVGGVEWANLQWPGEMSIEECASIDVFARVFEPGVTGDGEPDNIRVWIGVNDADIDPSQWDEGVWKEADYSADVGAFGDNAEYLLSIGSNLPIGEYYYASRIQLADGPFVYGGFEDGFWDGDNNVSGVLNITPILVTEVNIVEDDQSIEVGEEFQLNAIIEPGNATDQGVSWSSDDEEIATVSDEGVVTAQGEGSATIKVTTDDGGYTDTIEITVDPISVKEVSIVEEDQSIEEKETIQLNIEIDPADAANKVVNWSSSNEEIATVSGDGLVTGVKAGVAIITVTTDDGGHTDTIEITVEEVAVTGVEIDQGPQSIREGEELPLSATIAPWNATDQGVSWSSSDQGVATVSDEGVVSGLSVGEAIIEVTTDDGEHTDSIVIIVDPIEVTSVSINLGSQSINEGEEVQLSATVEPDNATDQDVSWSSDNEGVATVSDEGVVTGVSVGEATITVTTDDGGLTDSIEVNVAEDVVRVTGVSIEEDDQSIKEGEEVQLTTTVEPEDATNDGVSWSSDDENIATVDSNGLVSGVSVGEATITVTTDDGNYHASIVITVDPIEVTGVSIDQEDQSIEDGTTTHLTVTIEPDNATDKSVSWSSSDEGIAIVDQDGLVTAQGEGTAIITVTTDDGGHTDTIEITVTPIAVTGVEIAQEPQSIREGEEISLSATIEPADAANQDLSWSSENEDIATVSDEGVVTGLSVGNATIKVTTDDGGHTDSIMITVDPVEVTEVSIDQEDQTIKAGREVQLSATVEPENATNKEVIWSSVDPQIATVSENGLVTGVAVGNTEITVTNADGGFTDSIVVTVEPLTVDWANLQWPGEATIAEGNSVEVFAQVYEGGLTESGNPGDSIKAWIGVNAENTDPATWDENAWTEADYNSDQGNNAEYMAGIGADLAPGTYYYVSRVQLDNGSYVYGGTGGLWEEDSAVLNVYPGITVNIPDGYGEAETVHYWEGQPGNQGSDWNNRPELVETEDSWKGYTIEGVNSLKFKFVSDDESRETPDFDATNPGVWYVHHNGQSWQVTQTKPSL
ncbi:Ig-like domain-containing protein [Halonatronum saccharophilum]|uniref:Ig-like domain-containing protein n=1 Tax=Halonatronum saccharophilum TaxID=150060 RepID=UPI0004B7E569|nr:Ig-like domain-containing protein [Halonatronum saccharophilum]